MADFLELAFHARWVVVLGVFMGFLARERERLEPVGLLREIVIVMFAYFAYFGVRGMTHSNEAVAIAHGYDVARFEQWLGIFWEPSWQSLIDGRQAAINAANWMYIWGHWPLIAIAALWLFANHRSTYYLYRNAFIISGCVGLVVFALYPVAPPRLLDLGLTDTVTEYSNAYRVLQPPALTNQYAAVPSLHFGWNVLVGIALVSSVRSPAARALAVAVPVAMFFAIVLTANHFIIDAVAGVAVALFGLAVSAATAHWRAEHTQQAGHPANAAWQ